MNGNEPNKSAPWTYVAAILGSLFIVWILVAAMQSYLKPEPLGATRAAERQKNLTDLRSSEEKMLREYAWQDQEKGFVRLPISNAVEWAIQEFKDPAAARAMMAERVDEATFVPPPPPEAPSEFE
jgi:hypothetical protein